MFTDLRHCASIALSSTARHAHRQVTTGGECAQDADVAEALSEVRVRGDRVRIFAVHVAPEWRDPEAELVCMCAATSVVTVR